MKHHRLYISADIEGAAVKWAYSTTSMRTLRPVDACERNRLRLRWNVWKPSHLFVWRPHQRGPVVCQPLGGVSEDKIDQIMIERGRV